MASTSPFQQYLEPTDMTILDRVLKKVCVRNSIVGGSAGAERVAALLIREFQHGANTANLMIAIDGDGDFKLSCAGEQIEQVDGQRTVRLGRGRQHGCSISPSKELIS